MYTNLIWIYINVFSVLRTHQALHSSSHCSLVNSLTWPSSPSFFCCTSLCSPISPTLGVVVSLSTSHQSISPVEPTLGGSEEISAKDMSISNEMLLDCVKTGAPKTSWGVKAMSNTVRCLMIDSTHWHVYPGAGFHRPI